MNKKRTDYLRSAKAAFTGSDNSSWDYEDRELLVKQAQAAALIDIAETLRHTNTTSVLLEACQRMFRSLAAYLDYTPRELREQCCAAIAMANRKEQEQ